MRFPARVDWLRKHFVLKGTVETFMLVTIAPSFPCETYLPGSIKCTQCYREWMGRYIPHPTEFTSQIQSVCMLVSARDGMKAVLPQTRTDFLITMGQMLV